jgi:hypothetical protein
VSKTLGKACKTLGECFAECDTRQKSSANCTSAMTSLSSTFYRSLDKDFAECYQVLGKENLPSRRLVMVTEPLPSVLVDTRQRVSLCRAYKVTLDKEFPSLPSVRRTSTRQRGHQRAPLSAPLSSALGGTRQRLLLCRVPMP